LFFSHVTIPQVEGNNPGFIKMDSDVFIQGEVIKFHIVNEGASPLPCEWMPAYTLYRQTGEWEPLTKQAGNYYLPGNYWLEAGNSTAVEQVDTAGQEPGHYKIVKCGVSREFEIHASPEISATPR